MKNQTNQVVQNKLQFKSAKNYFASLILVLGLFFSFPESGIAQCPPGYTSVTITGQISGVSNCFYSVTYCYKCAPSGYDPSSVIITNETVYSATTNCNLLNSVVKDEIELAIRNDFMQRCTFPPCSQGVISIFHVERSICAKVKNTMITINGVTYYATSMTPCIGSEAACVTEYKVCIEYRVTPSCPNPPCYIMNFMQTYPRGTINCSSTQPQMPPVGKTWEDEWETDCFAVGCN